MRWLIALCGLAAFTASAETAYVTDQLRLGVHQASDTSDRAFTYVSSGDALEILAWERPYARVRLEDGREGWVKATFLVTEPPAANRITQVEAERDRLAEELDALHGGRDLQAERLAELEAMAAEARERAEASEAELTELRELYERARARLETIGVAVPLAWAALAVLAALILGMSLAWWWIDSRIRRRHGGFRVH